MHNRQRLPKWAQERYEDPYDYEEKTAEKLGGRREPASGAFSGRYDVNSEDIMVDNKITKHNSYSVDIRDYQDLTRMARVHDKMPALFVNFSNHGESLVVLREKDFHGLTGGD